MCKTYNSRHSRVVTHRSTTLPLAGLSTGERTGWSVLSYLWPYVKITAESVNISFYPRWKVVLPSRTHLNVQDWLFSKDCRRTYQHVLQMLNVSLALQPWDVTTLLQLTILRPQTRTSTIFNGSTRTKTHPYLMRYTYTAVYPVYLIYSNSSQPYSS